MHDACAILVGLNANSLAVARNLGRHGVRVCALGGAEPSPEGTSRYIDEVWADGGGQDSLVDALLSRAGGFSHPPILLPVTDEAVAAIAGSLDSLRGHYRIGMPEAAKVLTLLDKRGFADTIEALDLPRPYTAFVDRADEMSLVAAQMKYPCILKPQVKSHAYASTGVNKAFVAADAAELLAAYAKFSAAEPRAVVQEYIPGDDSDIYFCLQYYDRAGIPAASFSGRKLRQWPPLCGGTTLCTPVDTEPLASLTTAFFTAVGFHGLCSMEYKRDPRNGQYKMIEPTVCRTDWQSAVADLNGIPLPYIAYRDLAGLPGRTWQPSGRKVKWVHLASDRMSAGYYRSRRELTWLGWLGSLRPPIRGAFWAWDDPRPWLSIIGRKVRRKFQNRRQGSKR